MLLTWIAEVADEPLALEPDDRPVEWRTNTWRLSTDDAERRALSVREVAAAFEETADRIRRRIRERGFSGVATFYVWHDEQAGQLRCSTGSVPADRLPFGAAYLPVDDLGPIVEGYLRDEEPGLVPWAGLVTVTDRSVLDEPEPEFPPFPVWVRGVGAAPVPRPGEHPPVA
ncbi:hypothetical protein [Kitasatospora sp. CB01950]|uniref:hypothetical protein n=1 Tax=Kitasatospora sp. CB01950 TaxID=1703930 RepID=UPI00093A6A8E|nr:hypothetical protein [Kitasatospora sp. CB01950]OKJ15700.1 hypothetical protein AMK19_05335 [Kitasatospora sp. CB01950]